MKDFTGGLSQDKSQPKQYPELYSSEPSTFLGAPALPVTDHSSVIPTPVTTDESAEGVTSGE